MNKYTIRVITGTEEWGLIESEWNALLSRSDYNDIFLTFEWLYTWWSIFGRGELSIILLEHNNTIISIFPLYISKTGFTRVLKFIGTGVSDYAGYIIDKAYDNTDNFNQAFDFIIANLEWDVIDLQQIPQATSLYQYLNEKGGFTDDKRFNVKFYKLDKCLYIPQVEKSFTSNYNKSFYTKLKSQEKKLLNSGYLTHLEIQDIDQNILQKFFEMHIKKWHVSGKVSDFAFHKYREFHTEIIKKLAANSQLSFSALKFNDRYIAFTYAFNYNNKIYVYIKTYDPDYAKFSPGHLSFLYYLRSIQNSEITEVDLLRGEEEYKLNMAKSYRTNHRFILTKKNIKGKAYKLYAAMIDRLYKTKYFKGLTRYAYKVFRKCKLRFCER